MIFVDSNIWCYYFDSSSEEHKAVSEFMDEKLDNEEIALNTVVVMEVSHFLIKNLGGEEGENKIDKFLSFPFRVVDFDYSLMYDSVDQLVEESEAGIGGRDATILASMDHLDVEELITHDKAFKKIENVNVIDPVEL
ncbi:MAG: type II toxin-antitoxin system VapC family toxin [Candidatus Nanohaloarchaea archaeon]|nr:type II toxin-antitoxin system VapC family toxin [Candidatus Nanohaloarchaea archaeon]